MKKNFYFLFFLISMLHAPCSGAAENPSGLPVPRFVSLKSEEVNARSGPGINFPIKWVYNRKSLPVEIVAEFGNWRKIRDKEGEEGWVLGSLVSGSRSAIITSESVIYSAYKGDRMLLRLARNVQVDVKKCKESQCEVQYEKTLGWMDRSKLWGIYDKEIFD